MNLHTALSRSLISTLLIFGSYHIASAQPASIYRLPAGTRIKLKLDAAISSRSSRVNDTFLASISRPVTIRDATVLPVGTTIEGRVTGAGPAAAGGRDGKLDLAFETLMFSNDQRRSIDGILVNSLKPGSSRLVSTLSILFGTVAGAVVGGLTGSGRGTLTGAGIGGGIGAAAALSRKGKDVSIGKNVEFEIVLKKEVVLPVLDY